VILRRVGYRVVEAGSGEEAVHRFEEHFGKIRIIVSDIVMPGMHGPDMVQRLLDVRPDLCVLFISGYAEYSPLARMQNRRVAFLAKPFRTKELVGELARLVARSFRQVPGGTAHG
jgi:two-component system cell cycle sensor histidine kinase/response regulator CckA